MVPPTMALPTPINHPNLYEPHGRATRGDVGRDGLMKWRGGMWNLILSRVSVTR